MQRGAPASQSRAAACLAPPSLSDDGGLQTRAAIDQNERLRDEISRQEIEVQRRALEQAGVKFIEANKSGGPGVRLRETPHDRVSYPCGGSFELCVGREEATFCKAACRHAFWSAAQHWVMRAVGAGLLSSDIQKAAWANVHIGPAAFRAGQGMKA